MELLLNPSLELFGTSTIIDPIDHRGDRDRPDGQRCGRLLRLARPAIHAAGIALGKTSLSSDLFSTLANWSHTILLQLSMSPVQGTSVSSYFFCLSSSVFLRVA